MSDSFIRPKHGHAVALGDQEQAQGFDEGALADAGHARQADAQRTPRRGQQCVEQRVGACTVVRPRALQQRDGLGHGAALHRPGRADDAVVQGLVGFGQGHSRRGVDMGIQTAAAWALICSSTSLALTGIGVPGP